MSGPEAAGTHGEDMRAEYDLRYEQSKPNRFAGQAQQGLVVVLDDDIARVFRTPDSVRAVLRALIATMPSAAEAAADSELPAD